jgi:hypothetical protein
LTGEDLGFRSLKGPLGLFPAAVVDLPGASVSAHPLVSKIVSGKTVPRISLTKVDTSSLYEHTY